MNAFFSHFEIDPDHGAATTRLSAVVRGKSIPVFPEHDLAHFQKECEKDPELAFKLFNVPLFPFANRLRLENQSATVEGCRVNLPSQKNFHLHGLAFSAKATSVNQNKACFRDFFHGTWTGEAMLTVTQKIQAGEFYYHLLAKNTGNTPLPVGFGSHPYFQIPSHDPESLQLKIPAEKIAEINNLTEVFPTGAWLSVLANEARFHFMEGKTLKTHETLDHFFLFQESKKPPAIELKDLKAKISYTLTALTPNIIGAQVYYPGTGSIIAVEMLTHLPDPRKIIWKDQPTGMQKINPGETAEYGYKISVEADQ